MKKLVAFIAAASALVAAQNSTVIPFGGYLWYGNGSVKDSGYLAGVYMSGESDGKAVELQYSYVDIAYKDSSDNLRQNDFTLAISSKDEDGNSFRFGGHYIDSDDIYTDGGLTLFGGVHMKSSSQLYYGADLYYTNYKNFDPSLDVWQATPYLGKFIYGGYFGNFYFKASYTYIWLQSSRIVNSVEQSGRNGRRTVSIVKTDEYGDSYNSASISATHYYKRFTTTASFWLGEQAFAVRDGGFSVNNLPELHKGGVELKTYYSYSKEMTFGVSFGYERFTDTQSGEDTALFAAVASLSYIF